MILLAFFTIAIVVGIGRIQLQKEKKKKNCILGPHERLKCTVISVIFQVQIFVQLYKIVKWSHLQFPQDDKVIYK